MNINLSRDHGPSYSFPPLSFSPSSFPPSSAPDGPKHALVVAFKVSKHLHSFFGAPRCRPHLCRFQDLLPLHPQRSQAPQENIPSAAQGPRGRLPQGHKTKCCAPQKARRRARHGSPCCPGPSCPLSPSQRVLIASPLGLVSEQVCTAVRLLVSLTPPFRRAKDKQLRKRASDQEKPQSPQDTNSPDATAQDDAPATEQPQEPLAPPTPDPSPTEHTPALKISCSVPSPAWQISPGTPTDDIPPHNVPARDHRFQDPDLYSTRRGSLPAMPSLPAVQGADALHPSLQLVDRRNSLDVNCYRLMQHPFARIAKEKNEALFAKSPLSPPGSTQAVTRGPSAVRTVSHPVHPYSRPLLAHRASEPHAWAPLRGQFPPVPEGGPSLSVSTSPSVPSRRQYDTRLYAITARTLPSPGPGPLPAPDFQFGEPSSASTPPNASPVPGEGDTPPSSSSGSSAHGPSPDLPMSELQRWAFPRGSTTSILSTTSAGGGPRDGDGEIEDAVSTTASSSSFSGVSRFGSVASITGSDSSAMFSDVSSCVAAEMAYEAGRRGSR